MLLYNVKKEEMRTMKFSITQEQLDKLKFLYPNMAKNSDIGKLAVEISKLYFFLCEN